MSIVDLAPGEHATEVRNHWWWRPGWHVGRRFYAFHITVADQPELISRAAEYREAVSHLGGLTLIPDRWLHLTMQGVGFADEVQPGELDRIINAARERVNEVRPVRATFGDFVVGDEALAMTATPDNQLKDLRHVVRNAIAVASGQGRVPEDPDRFRPHISLAYIAMAGAAAPYIAAASRVDVHPATVTFKHVDLIEMHRDHLMYEWRVIATLDLMKNHET